MLLLDPVTKPKERPILFQGAMVRAILAGTKTQTRRVLKQAVGPSLSVGIEDEPGAAELSWLYGDGPGHDVHERTKRVPCPYGQPGDRLWVRETWGCHWMYDDVPPRECRSSHPNDNYWYRADPPGTAGTHGCPFEGYMQRWRPAIHMPRWVCRLVLEVTEVRVERLQSISESDAQAEGIDSLGDWMREREGDVWHRQLTSDCQVRAAAYSVLWDSINGVGNWDANPWVWAVSFRRVTA